MADSLTVNVKLTNQTEGGNNNSWGQIADANFEEIDDKFGDVTAISTTGGNTTLTDAQEIVNALNITGALVSNVTITFSGRGGTWIVKNATTGDYAVTCLVSGQTGVAVTQGTTKPVFSTGTDIAAAGADSSAAAIPAGQIVMYVGTAAPSTWVRANGRTVSNAAGGGTERANADTETLWLLLYASYSNTILPIQDSSGIASARTTGAADYALNKRLPLPDLRGRAFVGLDDMGNTAASRLGTIITSQTTNGASGGTETVVLVEANLAAHTHTGPSHTHTFSATSGTESATHTHSGTTASSGAHTHTYTAPTSNTTTPGGAFSAASAIVAGVTTSSDGAHTHTITTGTASATHTHSVSGTTDAGGTGATGSTGSGTAHSNVQPSWLGTFIIKL